MAVAPMFGARALRDAHMVTFFSQISWHVPTFQTCAANFSKPITDTNTMFPLKIAQVPGLHFRWKKIRKKIGFLVFFEKKFWKNAIFDCFLCLIPYFSEPGQNTGSMVSCSLQAFYRLHFRSKLASKFFSDLVFWAKKWMKKNVEKFFLICSSYFSKLTKDTETILPQDKQQGCKLGFAPTKFLSSRMTRSFFC